MPNIAGVDHDIIIDALGYTLTGKADGYVSEAAGVQNVAINFGAGNEVVVGAPYNTAPFTRLSFSNWRGLYRFFWDGHRETKTLAGENNPDANFNEVEGRLSDLIGLRPLLGGDVLGLTPSERQGPVGNPDGTTSSYRCHCYYGGQNYVAINTRLYSVSFDVNGNIAALNPVAGYTVGPAINHLAVANSLLYISYGFGGNAVTYNGTTFTTQSFASSYVSNYGSVLFYASGNALGWIVAGVAFSRDLGSQINSLYEYNGSLWIGTDTGLYRADGKLQPKDPVNNVGILNWFDIAIEIVFKCAAQTPDPACPAQARNFYSMTAAGGWLWYWQAGRIYRAKSNGGGSIGKIGALTIEPTPIYGKFRGMATCGNLIVVSVIETPSSFSTLYVHDPDVGSWFKLTHNPALTYQWPFSMDGCASALICLFMVETAGINYWPIAATNISGLDPNGFSLPNVQMYGQLALPQLEATDLVRYAGAKEGATAMVNLLRVGIEWAEPVANQIWPDASPWASSIYFQCGISLTGTSPVLALRNANGNANYYPGSGDFGNGRTDWLIPAGLNQLFPTSAINQIGSAAQVPTALYVQINLTATAPIAPAIRRVWIDYRISESKIATGRKWHLKLRAEALPEAVALNMQPDATMNAATTALWALWASGKTFVYQDIDGSLHNCKIGALKQYRSAIGAGNILPPDFIMDTELIEVVE